MSGAKNDGLKKRRNSRQLPALRQASITSFVRERGEVTISELATKFSVSDDTVRRDLDALDEEGVLIRTHGGAVHPHGFPRPDTGLDFRMRVQQGAKDVIGKLAANLVEDNTAIIINSGTTALALVRHLSNHRNLTIATNNTLLPSQIAPEAVRDLYFFGGPVRLVSQATLGPVSFPSAYGGEIQVRAKTAFIAVGAVSKHYGYSTSDLGEATMMRNMMRNADKVVVLADASKLNQHLFAKITGLAGADCLVTDARPPADLERALHEAGVKTHYPES